jgi:16S rRNA (guanine527-N7)-methyltransferase
MLVAKPAVFLRQEQATMGKAILYAGGFRVRVIVREVMAPAVDRAQLRRQLAEGCSKLGLHDAPIEPLLDYLLLLLKWNQTYNLSAIRDPVEAVTKHLLDCLSVVPYVQAKRLVDVGTGAGLPGIVLLLCGRCEQLILVESVGKKCRFMREALAMLGLRAQVFEGRVESLQLETLADAVISRAFSSLADFVKSSSRLLMTDGALLAMKGKFPVDELSILSAGWQLTQKTKLQVPGLNAERWLLHLTR